MHLKGNKFMVKREIEKKIKAEKVIVEMTF